MINKPPLSKQIIAEHLNPVCATLQKNQNKILNCIIMILMVPLCHIASFLIKRIRCKTAEAQISWRPKIADRIGKVNYPESLVKWQQKIKPGIMDLSWGSIRSRILKLKWYIISLETLVLLIRGWRRSCGKRGAEVQLNFAVK